MDNSVQKEITFYQDATVQVTPTRYITHSKTYAMRNISSVHIFEIVKSRKAPVLIVLVGLLMLFSAEIRTVGVFVIALGILILFLIKNEFTVRISTNSGEINSIMSKDRAYIQNIVDALNEAIIHIG